MKSLAEALLACEALSLTQRVERVALSEARGRYLCAALSVAQDAPRWNQSAMDGYAVNWREATKSHAEGVDRHYCIGQVIAAGHSPEALQEGEVARIMTGAPLPENTDTVVIQENVELIDAERAEPGVRVRFTQRPRYVGEHVRLRGEELSLGMSLLDAGRLLNPAGLALCASQGLTTLEVWARPRVAILSTGDELREPGASLEIGQIYASNATLLQGMIEEAGGVAIDCGVARDSAQDTREGFLRALAQKPDLILSSGGVSVGDFDPVKGVLADLGARLDFWKVKMKPGKPLAVGELAGVPVLALPGNPVSAAVSFLLFARPLIKRALGASAERARLKSGRLPLLERVEKKHARAELIRVTRATSARYGEGWSLAGGQSSAWLSPLERADALLIVPEGEVSWGEGTQAEALLLPWGAY